MKFRKTIVLTFLLIATFKPPNELTAEEFKADLQQVALDVKSAGDWVGSSIVCYPVPPLTNIKRIPNVIPIDGRPSKTIKIVAAKGEFEPASFVVFSLQDYSKVELKASDLKSEKSQLPSSAVDLKVVKCWYQGGTAWSSYFADPSRRELTPELLLNDENLIKVDTKTEDNYLRYDYPEGSKYVWVSYPQGTKPGKFNHDTEPVADSPTLKPISLNTGEGKQIWITVKIPENAQEGLYQGKISLVADDKTIGEMILALRVLPFVLPEPKTYYDLNRDFLASIWTDSDLFLRLKMNGMDFKQAEKKLLVEFKDMADHNLKNPDINQWSEFHAGPFEGKGPDIARREMEIYKESGLKTKPFFGGIIGYNGYASSQKPQDLETFKRDANEQIQILDKALGHRDIYAYGWDEPAMNILLGERELWKYLHSLGIQIWSTSSERHLWNAGFNEDYADRPGTISSQIARKWHAIGGMISTYATPHTGPENPDFIRRTHGMMLYKNDYDGTFNYHHYFVGGDNIWNEFDHGSYRSFCLVYPTLNGVIDTIEWEGFREGIDDIRYATKLRELAIQASGSKNVEVRYKGKCALQWLAILDENKADLNSARMEMINYILDLQSLLKG